MEWLRQSRNSPERGTERSVLRAIAVQPGRETSVEPRATVVLRHDERHLRRKVIALADGRRLSVDLSEAVMLAGGDALVLDDGDVIAIVAAEEDLYEITARDAVHLSELAWHIGNRHLAAAISADRILILRDHVIKAMLEGLGAAVRDVAEPFNPVRGAYSSAGHHDGHGRARAHEHHHHD